MDTLLDPEKGTSVLGNVKEELLQREVKNEHLKHLLDMRDEIRIRRGQSISGKREIFQKKKME